MSRKHIAGGCSSRLCRPASASCISSPSMMSPVHARVCCRWYIAITAPLGQGAHPIAEVDAEDLVGPLAGRDRRADHLGLPHGRLGLGDAAQAVALDADQLLDRGRAEAGLDRPPRASRRRAAPRRARGRPGAGGDGPAGLADEQQQLDRDAGPLGHLGERAPPSAENRSKAGASRKSSETRPPRIASPRPSSGMPAPTRLVDQAGAAEVPGVNRPSASGARIPSSHKPARARRR